LLYKIFNSFSEAFGNPNIQKALAEGNVFGMAKGLRMIRMYNLASDLANLWPALESFQPTLLLAGGISKSKTMLYSNLHTIPLVVVHSQVLLAVSDRGRFRSDSTNSGGSFCWPERVRSFPT
jgi:hypothetical protein